MMGVTVIGLQSAEVTLEILQTELLTKKIEMESKKKNKCFSK